MVYTKERNIHKAMSILSILGDIFVFNILYDRAIICLASSAQGSYIHFPTAKGKKSERRGREECSFKGGGVGGGGREGKNE